MSPRAETETEWGEEWRPNQKKENEEQNDKGPGNQNEEPWRGRRQGEGGARA